MKMSWLIAFALAAFLISCDSEVPQTGDSENLETWFLRVQYIKWRDAVFFVGVGDSQEINPVQRAGVSVEKRNDGKEYTSVKLSGKYDYFSYKTAIVLVPNEEDAKIWNDWLNSLSEEKLKYEENLKPRRVLPPD